MEEEHALNDAKQKSLVIKLECVYTPYPRIIRHKKSLILEEVDRQMEMDTLMA